ncbi:MAG TPA: hypothetical protein VFJ63_00615, partial [Candidatus Bathyarchaeia archaeon]|nr:hypothetical protein [Candidatus Bathyarchaeia archaeon]
FIPQCFTRNHDSCGIHNYSPIIPVSEELISPKENRKRAKKRHGMVARIISHPLSPFTKRAAYAVLVLAIVMAIGTVGLMLLEGWGVVDSFYFMSLLATAEGPALTPATVAGKIFASVMAFFSIGAAISAITFTFGPLFGSALKEGLRYVEKEQERLKEKLEHKKPETNSGSSQMEE